MRSSDNFMMTDLAVYQRSQAEQYPGVSDAYIRRYRDSRPDVRVRALGLTVDVMKAAPQLKAKVRGALAAYLLMSPEWRSGWVHCVRWMGGDLGLVKRGQPAQQMPATTFTSLHNPPSHAPQFRRQLIAAAVERLMDTSDVVRYEHKNV